jgi:transketolase
VNVDELNALANRLRISTLEMISQAGSSHVGTNFSMIDLLACLYGEILRVDPNDPQSPTRDRFVLSKGHGCASLYVALAETGFFPKAWLETFYQNGSVLSGHVTHAGVPGVELSTGSLGHGLPVSVGMAMSGKRRGIDYQVYCLLSDGECDEGSNWEAILLAAHHGLNNLTAIVDYNKIQSLASVAETIGLEPFADKWTSFGWEVLSIDGHDVSAICEALRRERTEQPRVIIADTVKGRGVSFMENSVLWHYRTPRDQEFADALAELTVT